MRFLGWWVATVLVVAGCGSAADAPAPRGPEAVLGPATLDLGRMHTEEERDVVYSVRNMGDRELSIERVDTTCGCVRPKFPRRLAPGEEGEIAVRFVPAIEASGLITEGVKVFTNAREEPFLLTFKVDLEPPVRLSPGSPLVMPIEPGGTAAQIVMFTPRAQSNTRVLGFASDDPRVRVESLPDQMGASAARATVRSPGTGDFQVRLALRTTHDRMKEFPYTVQLEAVRGPVSSPATLDVSAMAASAKDAPLPPLLVFARDRTIQVLSARTGTGTVEVQVGERTPAGTPVQLRYKGGWQPGRRMMELTIETDHPTHPVLKVRVEIQMV